MNTPLTTNEKIIRVLSRLPLSGPIHDRAAELVDRHRRCALQAVRSGAPFATRSERLQVVELYRRALLAELGDLVAEADLARVREGGGATC